LKWIFALSFLSITFWHHFQPFQGFREEEEIGVQFYQQVFAKLLRPQIACCSISNSPNFMHNFVSKSSIRGSFTSNRGITSPRKMPEKMWTNISRGDLHWQGPTGSGFCFMGPGVGGLIGLAFIPP